MLLHDLFAIAAESQKENVDFIMIFLFHTVLNRAVEKAFRIQLGKKSLKQAVHERVVLLHFSFTVAPNTVEIYTVIVPVFKFYSRKDEKGSLGNKKIEDRFMWLR